VRAVPINVWASAGKKMLDKQKEFRASVFTLHKYFLWATQMRDHFYALVPEFSADPNRERLSEAGLKIDLYMSLWYGMLYVVAEGWQELKLSDPAVDSLLDSPNLNLLRLYRNGTFHFQKDLLRQEFFGVHAERRRYGQMGTQFA
jgi:hypothetical protein